VRAALGWEFALDGKSMTAGDPLLGYFSRRMRGRFYSGVGSAPANQFLNLPQLQAGVRRALLGGAFPCHGFARSRGDFDLEE
jgi:hypothetical protein